MAVVIALPPWLGWLGDPTGHAFVPSPRNPRLCFACDQVAEEHYVELEYREARIAELRRRERREARRSLGLEP